MTGQKEEKKEKEKEEKEEEKKEKKEEGKKFLQAGTRINQRWYKTRHPRGPKKQSPTKTN